MVVVYDEAEDGKWITIHPNGSEKGKHVKVGPDGEIVAGNKHLVAALKKKDASGTQGGKASSPGSFPAFEPPDFGSLTSLLDDGDEKATGPASFDPVMFTVAGEEYEFGRGKVGSALLKSLISVAPGLDKETVYGAWNGTEKCILGIKAKMPANHPFIKALGEYEKVVEERKAAMPHVDFHKAAKEITGAEASKMLKGSIGDIWVDYYTFPLPKKCKEKHLEHGDVEEMGKSYRYAAVAVDDFRKRFPGAQLLDTLKGMVLYPTKPKGNNLGMCWPYLNKFAWGASFGMFADDGEKWRQRHRFVLAPGCGTVPSNTFMYAENRGAEAAGVFWHEVAHALYPQNRKQWRAAKEKAFSDYGFNAADVSKYATTNIQEYHSEVVGLMALPNYVQGSLPEPIERYVYEKVFGMKPGSWKKNQSVWKPNKP